LSTAVAPGLHYLQLTELSELLRTRAVSPVEVTRAQLDRIAALDGTLASYVTVIADQALADAERACREIGAGHHRGVLHGVPIAIKDLFWTKDAPAAAGMTIYRDFWPGQDATAVARLRDAGAVIMGKLQMTEGAYSDHHPSVTPPVNPWDAAYWTGISSSGPAVATAAGLCYAALASDTGGSIRWPCAATGLTGIKPTWGRVSRHGTFALAPSMDHVGPIARSATDAAAIMYVIAGADPADPTSLPDPAPDPGTGGSGVAGLRIGVDPGWNGDAVHPDVQAAVSQAAETFRDLGARIVELTAPDISHAIADWAPLCAVEAAVAHQATYPARQDEYGPVLASVLEAGRAVTGLGYQEILLRRMTLRGQFAALFETVDLMLTPVQPFAPLTLAEIQTLGEKPDLILQLQRYTAPFDLTGSPTITLPGGFTGTGLPIGIQLVAPHLHEPRLCTAASAFQSTTAWHRRHPPS
jgi:amidase